MISWVWLNIWKKKNYLYDWIKTNMFFGITLFLLLKSGLTFIIMQGLNNRVAWVLKVYKMTLKTFSHLLIHFISWLKSTSPFSSQSHLHTPPLIPTSPSPLRREDNPHCYQHTLAPHVTAGLGASSPTATRQGSPAKSQNQPLLHLLGDPHGDHVAHLLHICRGPRSSVCCWGWILSWASHGCPFP